MARTGGGVGPGRSSEGHPGRLRGEPPRAGRSRDRPLPPPRARPADPVAHVVARARPDPRGGPRAAGGRLQRQPPPARRGARARPDRGRPGGAQPVRRSRAAGRRRRALHRGRDRRDRPLAARRAEARRPARPHRCARRRSGRARRDSGRGRARVAARAVAGGGRDPRSAASRDRPLGRRPPRLSGSTPSSAPRSIAHSAVSPPPDRRGRARPRPPTSSIVMGIPGAGKSRIAEEHVARGYLRLNRDERGGSLRDVAGALDEALAAGTRRVVLDNTYLTRAARSHVVEVGRPARRRGALRLARHAARAGPGQPRRAPPRPPRLAPGARRAARARPA